MENHGRNGAWGVKAVKEASNLTEQEALEQNVIDLVATDLAALLETVDGREVSSPGRSFTLKTAGARIDTVEMSLFQRLLNGLIDPNIIRLLFLLALIGIALELFNPGTFLPGIVGTMSLIGALWGMSILPVDWAGLALIVLGVGLFVVEAHVPANGAIAVAGIASLATGMVMLFRHAPEPYDVDATPVLLVTVLFGALVAFFIAKAIRAMRLGVATGTGILLGTLGEVRTGGFVFIRGELWQARSADGEALAPGTEVAVEEVDGLSLVVRPVHEREHST
jgi:membrane-bound serine protease (ClpP class)